MEQQPGAGSEPGYLLTEEEEIQHLISVTQNQESTSTSFTALLELPPTQAMELLHSHNDPNRPGPGQLNAPLYFNASTLTFPSNSALIERAAKFSVFAEQHINNNHNHNNNNNNNNSNNSAENTNSPTNKHRMAVKPEPAESSGPTVENAVAGDVGQQRPSAKRKEREKKVARGAGTKKSKSPQNDVGEDGEKLPYVHVRARRGQATDSHSIAERVMNKFNK